MRILIEAIKLVEKLEAHIQQIPSLQGANYAYGGSIGCILHGFIPDRYKLPTATLEFADVDLIALDEQSYMKFYEYNARYKSPQDVDEANTSAEGGIVFHSDAFSKKVEVYRLEQFKQYEIAFIETTLGVNVMNPVHAIAKKLQYVKSDLVRTSTHEDEEQAKHYQQNRVKRIEKHFFDIVHFCRQRRQGYEDFVTEVNAMYPITTMYVYHQADYTGNKYNLNLQIVTDTNVGMDAITPVKLKSTTFAIHIPQGIKTVAASLFEKIRGYK